VYVYVCVCVCVSVCVCVCVCVYVYVDEASVAAGSAAVLRGLLAQYDAILLWTAAL
jgi:hypothetical protein